MKRWPVVLLAVLQVMITRPIAAQDPARDTLPDSTRSRSILPGMRLRELPIDDARHGLVLVPGVRLTGTDIGVTPFAALSIRGNSAARGNVYVDGASLRFQTRAGAGVAPALSSIDEVSVLTGVAPAWLGDASGGAIAYETRSGGRHWDGSLALGGEVGGASSAGYSRIDGSVGGPITRGGALTFLFAMTLQNERSSYRGPDASDIPSYLPAGVDTLADTGTAQVPVPLWEQVNNGLRRPMDWSTLGQFHSKLLYRWGASSRLSLTGIGGALEQRAFPGQVAADPALYTGHRLRSDAVILNWHQPVGAMRDGPLTSDLNLAFVNHGDISGPLDSATELATRESGLCFPIECFPAPPSLKFAGADILDLPAHDQLVRDIRTNSGTRGVPFFGTRPDVTQTARLNPYGLIRGWPTAGYGGTLSDVAERRWQGRWSLTWQPGASEVTAGFELERTHLSSYSSDIVRQIGTDIFTADPRRTGLFTDAHFKVEGGVLDLGLRYDRISPGGEHPNVPAFISSSGAAYWNPNAATDDTAYANSVSRTFQATRTQSAFSPRIRLTYPVTPTAEIRLAYSRTLEPLAWGTFFARSNSDLSFTDVRDLFGRDIDFASVGLAEGGVRFTLGPTLLDVGVYRKNSPIYIGRITTFHDPKDTTLAVGINVITVLDDTYTEGIDLGVQWQRGWLSLSGAYSLAHTTGTEASLTAPYRAPVTVHTAALGAVLQVPHDLRGSALASVARGMSFVVLGRVQSGEPYTLLQNTGSGVVAPGAPFSSFPAEAFNASSLPWFKKLDLRIAKTARIGGHDWSAYVDARNILGLSSLTSLFAETGGTTNPRHQNSVIGDPVIGTGEYANLRDEAANAGALQPDGTTVDLSTCATWASQANCVSLMRVEQRFGNGDRSFTLAEQETAFGSYYRDFFGAWRFSAPASAVRIGLAFQL